MLLNLELYERKKFNILFGLMYFVMFMWIFINNDAKIFKVGVLLLSTLIFSYYTKNIYNSPSFWYMTSAIISPLFIMI